MIVVKIEIWPGGDVGRKRDAAIMTIANIGGDQERGDYQVHLTHQAGSGFGPAELPDPVDVSHGRGVWKSGVVRGFKRQSGAARLVFTALRALFAGTGLR